MKANFCSKPKKSSLLEKRSSSVQQIVVGVFFICVMGVVTNICPENQSVHSCENFVPLGMSRV